MNVFFDVDYTLIGDDGTLRPGARDVLEQIVQDGHALYIWSGRGLRWPEVRRHGLESLVSGVHEKPLYRHRERLELLGVPVVPDFVVDDHEEVVEVFGGALVSPYWRRPYDLGEGPAPADPELLRVYELVTALAARLP